MNSTAPPVSVASPTLESPIAIPTSRVKLLRDDGQCPLYAIHREDLILTQTFTRFSEAHSDLQTDIPH